MAIEIFMRMDGIAGASRNYHHKGSAEILSWTWGLNRTRDAGEGGKATTRMNEITITKGIGIESPGMMAACAAGTPIKQIQLSVVPVVGKREVQQKYLVITFETAIIKSISTGGSVDDGFIREKITLQFRELKYDFFGLPVHSESGSVSEPECFSFAWDLATNSSLTPTSQV